MDGDRRWFGTVLIRTLDLTDGEVSARENDVARGTGSSGQSVTARALSLLAAFDDRHRRLTLTELSRRADMPLPTAHRLVGDLVAWGALSRLECGRFVVGRRLWYLGRLAEVQATLVDTAAPHLRDLHTTTGAAVHLGVRDGVHALLLERLCARPAGAVRATADSRSPLHATGVGRVLLAHAPVEVRDQVFTHRRRRDPCLDGPDDPLRRQLRRICLDDVAITAEDPRPGTMSVATPVRRGDEAVAAIGLIVAITRRDQTQLQAALRRTAQEVGRAWQA